MYVYVHCSYIKVIRMAGRLPRLSYFREISAWCAQRTTLQITCFSMRKCSDKSPAGISRKKEISSLSLSFTLFFKELLHLLYYSTVCASEARKSSLSGSCVSNVYMNVHSVLCLSKALTPTSMEVHIGVVVNTVFSSGHFICAWLV